LSRGVWHHLPAVERPVVGFYTFVFFFFSGSSTHIFPPPTPCLLPPFPLSLFCFLYLHLFVLFSFVFDFFSSDESPTRGRDWFTSGSHGGWGLLLAMASPFGLETPFPFLNLFFFFHKWNQRAPSPLPPRFFSTHLPWIVPPTQRRMYTLFCRTASCLWILFPPPSFHSPEKKKPVGKNCRPTEALPISVPVWSPLALFTRQAARSLPKVGSCRKLWLPGLKT